MMTELPKRKLRFEVQDIRNQIVNRRQMILELKKTVETNQNVIVWANGFINEHRAKVRAAEDHIRKLEREIDILRADEEEYSKTHSR